MLLVADGFEAGDVLAESAELVSLLDLTGLLTQAEVQKFFAGFAELGIDLDLGEFFNFLGFHECGFSRGGLDGGAFADDEAALERQLGIGETECLFGNGGRYAAKLEEHGTGFDLSDVVFHAALT